MKKPEIVQLAAESPDLFERSLALEDRYRSGKHWRAEEASTLGLGRRFSWREFAEDAGLEAASLSPAQNTLFS